MSASVVVATLGQSRYLDDCLAALAADSPDELLVVDNAPSPSTAAAARRHGARWLPEPRPGKSHALNTGVAAATGDAVLFTDDDVVVHRGWSAALAAAVAQPGVGAAGGRLLPRWEGPPRRDLGPWTVHLTLVDHGPAPRDLEPPDDVFGASLAVRADVLRRLAPPFDPRLGPRPGLKLGHEELHLAARVRATGLRVVHAPDAVAEHCIDPERGREWLRRTVFQSGAGGARSERLRGQPVPSMPRRLAELGVSVLRVARTDALGEWAQLGRRVERVAGRWPALSDRLLTVLAPS